MNIAKTIWLEILLENPFPGVDIGLQKGSGSNYETVQKQRASDSNLIFLAEAVLKGNPEKDPLPDFSGAFVQGPKGGRFIYLDIGVCAGQLGSIWTRRLKIPLSGIPWEMLQHASKFENPTLKTEVAGRAKDGGPSCATAKPLNGWKL